MKGTNSVVAIVASIVLLLLLLFFFFFLLSFLVGSAFNFLYENMPQR